MASFYNTSSVSVNVDGVIGLAVVMLSYVLLVVPLSLYVLYLGFLQWKSKRNDASWFVGHSDFSTYNLAVMEIFGLAGFTAELHGKINGNVHALLVGTLVNKVPYSGQLLFPIFTCMEHYLAVVRPMTYLNLKRANVLRIRNGSAGVTWLIAAFGIGYLYAFGDSHIAQCLVGWFQMFVCLSAVIFCCVSVLHVLTQPKPGDESKGKFDKSKRRAMCTILAIMCTLMVNLMLNLIMCSLCISNHFWCLTLCPMMHWLNHFSSVVLFLLYLKRAGKLASCKRNTDK